MRERRKSGNDFFASYVELKLVAGGDLLLSSSLKNEGEREEKEKEPVTSDN